MERRFGDSAAVVYHNVQDPEVRESRSALIEEMETRGLLYPVTVIDGVPVYDGAVSYPGILRAIRTSIEQAASV